MYSRLFAIRDKLIKKSYFFNLSKIKKAPQNKRGAKVQAKDNKN